MVENSSSEKTTIMISEDVHSALCQDSFEELENAPIDSMDPEKDIEVVKRLASTRRVENRKIRGPFGWQCAIFSLPATIEVEIVDKQFEIRFSRENKAILDKTFKEVRSILEIQSISTSVFLTKRFCNPHAQS